MRQRRLNLLIWKVLMSIKETFTHAHQKKHLKLKDCNLNSQYPYEYSFADYGASKYNNINVNKLWLN